MSTSQSPAAKAPALLPLPVVGALGGLVAGLVLFAAGMLHIFLGAVVGPAFDHYALFLGLQISVLALAGLLMGYLWPRSQHRTRWYFRWTIGGFLTTSLLVAVWAGQPWQWSAPMWVIAAGLGPLLGVVAGGEAEP